jgi:hypothetical protein
MPHLWAHSRVARHAGCAAVAAIAVTAVAGCGGSSGPAASATVVPTLAPTTPTPTPVVTVTRQPTPSPSPIAPPRPVARPARDGDVDGDGVRDRVTVAGPGAPAGTWRLVAHLSTLGRETVDVPADTPAAPTIAGIVDADGDGFAEIWVNSAAGASTSFVTPIRLVNDHLRVVELDGAPATLGENGSVTHGDGFACTDYAPSVPGRELVVYSGGNEPGTTTWDGTIRAFRWSGARLVEISHRTERFHAGDAGSDPRLAKYYAVTCGSLGG